MKLCPDHWEQLRFAVRVRGMEPYVSKNMAELQKKLAAQDMKGAISDPLADAVAMIYQRALEDGGIYLLVGEICPLCELEKVQKGGGANWINGATDALAHEFRQRGLIQEAS
jgi:hypothetical protein